MSENSAAEKRNWLYENLFQILIAIIGTLCTLFVNDMRGEVEDLTKALEEQNKVLQELVIGIRQNESRIQFNEKRIERLENLVDEKK